MVARASRNDWECFRILSIDSFGINQLEAQPPPLPHAPALSHYYSAASCATLLDRNIFETPGITTSTMAANFDNQASTNYKEAFSLFDKRGNGRVALDSLGDLLRACGQNPTLSEIRDLEKNVGGDCELDPFFRAQIAPNT